MKIAPVVKEITVPAEPEAAFRRFTEEIDRWWPRSTHSVHREACAEVRFEGRDGGRVYERSVDGEESEWGRVTTWDPHAGVAFTWHPGRDASTRQEVEVRFTEVEGGTRVRLVHSGWERLEAAVAETRDGYDTGWDLVLSRFTESWTDRPAGAATSADGR